MDLARLGPGLHSSQILADFGTGVIKVEPTGRGGGHMVVHAVLSPNTRSIRMNLKKPEAREVFEKLVATVDVVVEGFRPGVAKRLGLDSGALSRIKDDIICVSLSGFGQEGPYSRVVALRRGKQYELMLGGTDYWCDVATEEMIDVAEPVQLA